MHKLFCLYRFFYYFVFRNRAQYEPVPVCKFNVIFTVNYKNVRATILEYSVLISGLNTIFLLCNAVSCLVLNFFIYIELSTENLLSSKVFRK